MSATIDPSDLVESATTKITAGVSDNLPTIGTVAGGLLAVGVVWRMARKFLRA
jgi:hypothetical protein